MRAATRGDRRGRAVSVGAAVAVAATLAATLAAPPASAATPGRSTASGAPRGAAPAPGHGLVSHEVRLPALDGGVERRSRVVRAGVFSMVGATWRGEAPEVRVRVHSDGVWRPWRALPLLTDGPDAAVAAARHTRSGTDLTWTGRSDAVRVAVSGGSPSDLTLVLMQPARATLARAQLPRSARRPTIRSRQRWGADPSLRSGRPVYNRTIQQVHLHHTVNSNGYARGDVPGLIRGIYRYHTQNLGWSDIGYNFLVDRFGRTWLGRAGGAKRAVRGAHTLGFNSTSTGVAVIGNFETGNPGHKVVTAIVRLAAWKLHRYHRHPRQRVTVWSHGSDRYPTGRRVRLPTIDGHRDTNETACPGERLYRLLPVIRRRTAQRMRRF